MTTRQGYEKNVVLVYGSMLFQKNYHRSDKMDQDISMKNTKKELLEVIEKMQREVAEKEEQKLNPEKVKTEAKKRETIKKAEEITKSDLSAQIHELKIAINGELSTLAESIESEAKKYTVIQDSIALKQSELEEIYGIEKQAASLAVILESQNQVKEEFQAEMSQKREKLALEIATTKASWELERKDYKESLAEEKSKTEKERKRDEDEYQYSLQRSRALAEDDFADKIATLEKEISEKKEQLDKHVQEKTVSLDDRTRQFVAREENMDELEAKVAGFPAELEATINSTIKQKEKELTAIYEQEKALLTKGFEGDHKVFEAKISALESLVKDQAKQIEKLSNQQEKAYQQVQDIAAKAVTGASERPQAITVKTVEKSGNNS